MVADVAGPGERVTAFGLQRIGINVGWAIGPALGGFLASVIDYGLVFFCAVIPLFISALVIAGIREPVAVTEAGPARPSVSLATALREAAGRRELLLLLVCALVFAMFIVFPAARNPHLARNVDLYLGLESGARLSARAGRQRLCPAVLAG